jgi:transcriptional regulator with XRE-family HTH domain
MGKAGQALKQALKTYRISQNKLAVTLGVDRSIVFRWFHEQTDPTGETIVEIVQALKGIEPAAAKKFVQLYLGELVEDSDSF